jgi:hypothetical protein
MDVRSETCAGTFVTKIGSLLPNQINPFTNPVEYEKQMADTLKELVITERKLMLYRKSMRGQNGEAFSPPGSEEAAEWSRLNARKIQLSGRPHYQPVHYFAHDPFNPSKKYPWVVQNQRGYMQKEGSCPVFSIKSFVASVIGPELAMLHIDYLQRHDGKQHVQSLQKKSDELQKRIELLEPPIIAPKETAKKRVRTFRKELEQPKTKEPVLLRDELKRLADEEKRDEEKKEKKFDLVSESKKAAPELQLEGAKEKCAAISEEIKKYEKHLSASLNKNKEDISQKEQIEKKQKVVGELKAIMNASELSDSAKLTALIIKLNEQLPSGSSTVEFLKSSRIRKGFGASLFAHLPVKGNDFIEALEKIIGKPLASFDVHVRKHDM